MVIHDDAFLADAEPVSGNPRALWMPGDKLIEAAGNSDILEKGIYLGDYRGVPFFALCVSASVAGMLTSDCDLKRSFVDLRSNLGRMPAGDANVVSLAQISGDLESQTPLLWGLWIGDETTARRACLQMLR